MFYYRYKTQDGNWSDILVESSERRCKDNLYGMGEYRYIQELLYDYVQLNGLYDNSKIEFKIEKY